jgi:hypothetical protein
MAILAHYVSCIADIPEDGMDIAMAMGLTLFGMFAGSTVLFFYRFAR